MLRNDKFIFDYLQPILQVLALKLTARDWRGLAVTCTLSTNEIIWTRGKKSVCMRKRKLLSKISPTLRAFYRTFVVQLAWNSDRLQRILIFLEGALPHTDKIWNFSLRFCLTYLPATIKTIEISYTTEYSCWKRTKTSQNQKLASSAFVDKCSIPNRVFWCLNEITDRLNCRLS